MILPLPTNCWSANLQSFSDAIANSPAFQSLVGVTDGDPDKAAPYIFGKRLTHSRDGHAWTADELATLRHYAMVYSAPEAPYGKRLHNNHCYKPFGTPIVALGRLVLEKDLVYHGGDRTGLNDVHDREWTNSVGKVIDEMLDWLQENGGPYPILSATVTEDFETRAENQPQQGMWQYSEVAFSYQAA